MARAKKKIPRPSLPPLPEGKVKDAIDAEIVAEGAKQYNTALWRNAKRIMEKHGEKHTSKLEWVEQNVLRRLLKVIAVYKIKMAPEPKKTTKKATKKASTKSNEKGPVADEDEKEPAKG